MSAAGRAAESALLAVVSGGRPAPVVVELNTKAMAIEHYLPLCCRVWTIHAFNRARIGDT